MSNPLQDLKDQLSRMVNQGMTRDEAVAKDICVRCKLPMHELGHPESRFKTITGVKEYQISGLCEYCFDEIMEGYND
jgi:hypothetical protein